MTHGFATTVPYVQEFYVPVCGNISGLIIFPGYPDNWKHVTRR